MKKQNIIMLVGLTAVLFLGILFSPLFTIKEIRVTEMERYSREEILEKININIDKNMFMLNVSNEKKTLKKNPYFESVEIKRIFPGTIDIVIKERRIDGYVPFMGAYLYIDGHGRVLESASEILDKHPVFRGLEFSSFKIGEKLDVSNATSLTAVVRMSQLMSKYDFENRDIKIDVGNANEIHIYVNQIDVIIGDITDCDKKVRVFSVAIEELSENARGKLFLNEGKGTYRFQHMT